MSQSDYESCSDVETASHIAPPTAYVLPKTIKAIMFADSVNACVLAEALARCRGMTSVGKPADARISVVATEDAALFYVNSYSAASTNELRVPIQAEVRTFLASAFATLGKGVAIVCLTEHYSQYATDTSALVLGPAFFSQASACHLSPSCKDLRLRGMHASVVEDALFAGASNVSLYTLWTNEAVLYPSLSNAKALARCPQVRSLLKDKTAARSFVSDMRTTVSSIFNSVNMIHI